VSEGLAATVLEEVYSIYKKILPSLPIADIMGAITLIIYLIMEK